MEQFYEQSHYDENGYPPDWEEVQYHDIAFGIAEKDLNQEETEYDKGAYIMTDTDVKSCFISELGYYSCEDQPATQG